MKKHKTLLFILVPLVLSAFTHLWNPVGFPAIHVDEGHYMRRAMQVLNGLGPQEPRSLYHYSYDHPYFGQLFLAAIFKIIGYPDSLSPKTGDLHSIEMLFFVPRVLMGILAIVDTFLIYKIAERKYNRNVAFIASVFFAVMPLSWLTRGIFLDSILLPFLLLSILFAIYSQGIKSIGNVRWNRKHTLILLSGIFLGIAIFTKAPAFTMIPLVAVLIIKNNDKKLKTLTMLLFPAVLIPLIWPVYSLFTGNFDNWINGVGFQLNRAGDKPIYYSIPLVFQIDPVLLTVGTVGLVYTLIRRNYFVGFWIIPFFIFISSLTFVTHFHWILILPALCISSAILLYDCVNFVKRKKILGRLSESVLISAFMISGLVMTLSLVTLSLNSTYIEIYDFTIKQLQEQLTGTSSTDKQTTSNLMGSQRIMSLVWIPKYIFNMNVTFRDIENPAFDDVIPPKKNDKILYVVDSGLRFQLSPHIENDERYRRAGLIFYDGITIATFINNETQYDLVMNVKENHGLGKFNEVKEIYQE